MIERVYGFHKYLRTDELTHGTYYYGRCRNAVLARWNAEEAQFYHWREKFGNVFIETIKHPEDDAMFDVFYPENVILSQIEIPFDTKAVYQGDLNILQRFL